MTRAAATSRDALLEDECGAQVFETFVIYYVQTLDVAHPFRNPRFQSAQECAGGQPALEIPADGNLVQHESH